MTGSSSVGGSWGGLRKTVLQTSAWLLFATLGFSFGYLLTRPQRSAPSLPDPIATAPRAGTTAGGPTSILPADVAVPEGMVLIPGGEFTMGTDAAEAWEDEKPSHPVVVEPFLIDIHEVTNAQFARFIEATGYETTAEQQPKVEEILAQLPPGTPHPDPEVLVPGSIVFTPPAEKVPLNDFSVWWQWVPGASWRHPEGPDSNLEGREQHPVVQVSWDDAQAYVHWAGKRLPTEAEWERAARGGLSQQLYVWGDTPPRDREKPEGYRANLWQGEFPNRNTAADGWPRTSPVKTFPPNPYGLYDMAGNVWEWCSDWYQRDLYQRRPRGSATVNPLGPEESSDPTRPFTPQRSQRGGSFLCHDTYCSRYRPSARHGSSPDTGMSHVGFRCALSLPKTPARP
ncbi:MAG: formylglycine-generating enzyme family protein [Planctomycetaceae bacterium]